MRILVMKMLSLASMSVIVKPSITLYFLAKYYLHTSAIKNTQVQFQAYKQFLKNKLEIQRYMFCYKEKLDHLICSGLLCYIN